MRAVIRRCVYDRSRHCVLVFFFFCLVFFFFFFFKQKTAYEIYQCDWSSDVCSSDLKSITGQSLDCQRNITQAGYRN